MDHRRTFNLAADSFDHPALSFWNRYGKRTIEISDIQKAMRVLDVCCGSGASAIPAAEAVGKAGYVLGLDISENLIKLAKDKARIQKLEQLHFLHADFESFEIPTQPFDSVICVFGIFFLPNMESAIQKMWKAVKPGGTLTLTIWGTKSFEPVESLFWRAYFQVHPDFEKPSYPWEKITTKESLKELMVYQGLTNVRTLEEAGTHPIPTAQDWWKILQGSGFRSALDSLSPKRLKMLEGKMNEQFNLKNIKEMNADVVYGIATKIA